MRATTHQLTALLLAGALLASCSKHASSGGGHGGTEPAAGSADKAIITIDGSSTVFPITEAVAEELGKQPKTKVTIGVSGSGGGFKKLCQGEIDISGASRPIKPTEVALCKQSSIEVIEGALHAVPMQLREGAYALGADRLGVLRRVTVPAAFSGIVASVILAEQVIFMVKGEDIRHAGKLDVR